MWRAGPSSANEPHATFEGNDVTRRFETWDVFTDRPLAGNPLAIVLDAEGLDDTAMQGIAREFNLSETVFVLPARNPAHSAEARIFTPSRELPFAGHPTVGTAICVAANRFQGSAEHEAVVVLEEKVGPVRCGVRLTDGAGFAEFDCPKLPEPLAGEAIPKEFIAAALSLAPADIGFENHVASAWSAGVPFHFVPVRDKAALAQARPDRGNWQRAFRHGETYLYTRDTEGHDHSFRARMFAPALGIEEDPATGSAAAALPGAIHTFDALTDGAHVAIIEQGFDMGRPSLIRLEIGIRAGAVDSVRIGGDAVRVSAGTLAL
jgi:trans-2,3-dihydro-3-hydroxyanthranilate isomerase